MVGLSPRYGRHARPEPWGHDSTGPGHVGPCRYPDDHDLSARAGPDRARGGTPHPQLFAAACAPRLTQGPGARVIAGNHRSTTAMFTQHQAIEMFTGAASATRACAQCGMLREILRDHLAVLLGQRCHEFPVRRDHLLVSFGGAGSWNDVWCDDGTFCRGLRRVSVGTKSAMAKVNFSRGNSFIATTSLS